MAEKSGGRWVQVLPVLRRELGERRFDYWFDDDCVVGVTRKGNTLTLWVTDDCVQAYMEDALVGLINKAVLEVTGEDLDIDIRIDAAKAKKFAKT